MGRRRVANAAAGGIACTVEATVGALAEGSLVVRAVVVQCGGKPLYEANSVPESAAFAVEERPALDAGAVVYVLRYRDERAEIDTTHGSAVVDVTKPVIGAASLVVAGESRPMKERLATATLAERVFPGKASDRLSGRVTNVTGDTLVPRDAVCSIALVPYGPADGPGRCDVLVQCGPITVLGQPGPFSARCTRRGSKVIGVVDGEAEPADDDPGLLIDEHTARIWNGANGDRWLVTLALDPPPAP
jgi:hypothetical protein